MAPEQIATAFRNARLGAYPLAAYPAPEVPATLEAAYAIQDVAIAAFPDQVVGWKVAAVQPVWRDKYPAERVAGPVFARRLVIAGPAPLDTPVILGGYAAVEAEFAVLIGPDFPLHTIFASAQELAPFVGAVHAAIEMAGSPLPTLSPLGPGAVVSDFGNNTGLIVGPALPGFLARDAADCLSETQLNGALAGQGSAAKIPGGPLDAVLFLIKQLASRGKTLRPGDWVSTGASTGIHPVKPGDQVSVSFDGKPALSLNIVEARPAAAV